MEMSQKAIILGAAGRDFHNFNTYLRDNPSYEVAAFTATQIPNIDSRKYPAELAGSLYPGGIPIYTEAELESLIEQRGIEVAFFSYSDVSHETVMHVGSRVLACGADFVLLGPQHTMLAAGVPVVSVCAARTGAGKSQTSRQVVSILSDWGKTVVAVRHPMPYGDLSKQAVQRFATEKDLERHKVTIEEREEYEPYVTGGQVIYAGVDYQQIVREAEKEAEIIVWDGGNNDLPFFEPDLHIVVVDPHRAADITRYHPGEANVRMADVIVINKVDTASMADVYATRDAVVSLNEQAVILEAASPIFVDDPSGIRGKRVLVVEDGPTLTHGGMAFGAGWVAAKRYGAKEIVDPRPYAVRSISETYAKYQSTGPVLPAMGYGQVQIGDLEETINNARADVVVSATPVDLLRIMKIDKPVLRVRYSLQVLGTPTLEDVLCNLVDR